jgi:hypothetical protein
MRGQARPGGGGGGRCGGAARAAGAADGVRQRRHPAFDLELPHAGLFLFADQMVLRALQGAALQPFLQTGFRILERLARLQLRQRRAQQVQHPLAADLDAGVQIDGADQGLEGVGQDGGPAMTAGLALAGAQFQEFAQTQPVGGHGQRLAADHARAQARELALGGLRETLRERLGNHESEQGITQELQALVVLTPRTAVGQGAAQQARVGETVAQAQLQQVQRVRQSLPLTVPSTCSSCRKCISTLML